MWQGFPVADEFLNHRYPGFLQSTGGLQLSLLLTASALFFGAFPGLVLALLRGEEKQNRSLPVRMIKWFGAAVSRTITETVRAIPVMTIVLLFFYLPYPLLKLRVPPVVLAVAALSLYASVYLGEILRSGLKAVAPETLEAAKLLGLRPLTILIRIRLPIAFRTMLPAVTSLLITIFKDTSVLTAVAVGELTYTGRQLFTADPESYQLILIIIVFIYWSISFLGSKIVKHFEKYSLQIFSN